MPIPDYQSVMLPLLRLAASGPEHRVREAVEKLAAEFQLSDSERAELLPSGTAPLFDNRVGWARTYLKQAGLLTSPKRGMFQITERGRSLIAENPSKIDVALLDRFDEFRSFRMRRREGSAETSGEPRTIGTLEPQQELPTDQTPEDLLASAYRRLRSGLELEIIEQAKAATPAFFERLVIDLLVSMGYGGSREDAGRAIGKSGDGGIDGMIKEDKLGLDVIYVQAKKWEGTVGRPEIQKFAGALQGQRASKGVFITTSSYTREAIEYAGIINSKIILIDGQQLAALMVDHNVGVSTVGMYELKKLDTDYFEGE
ncbi:restriction endonuclease [Variovorax sp. J2P1-59]|uniref:restriction endonuclease n=1 Tax=Variovorax flavidus TaxID=3053501 RepID=UPI0025785C87|nr:restriction endonuclease [Variovorax sp. J2P1-59]MDM0073970.1 restriction endonuclease [Variovorax sp. J2P1-59]